MIYLNESQKKDFGSSLRLTEFQTTSSHNRGFIQANDDIGPKDFFELGFTIIS